MDLDVGWGLKFAIEGYHFNFKLQSAEIGHIRRRSQPKLVANEEVRFAADCRMVALWRTALA